MNKGRWVLWVVLGALACFSAVAAVAKAARKIRPVKEPTLVKLKNPVAAPQSQAKLPGTIIYDTGTASGFLAAAGWSVGNRFNTASGQPVQPAGTVTKVSFYLLAGTGSGSVTVWDQVTTNLRAPIVQQIPYSGLSTGNWHTLFAMAHYQGISFLVGLLNQVTNTSTPNGDTPGLDPNTAGGQGYHAMMIYHMTTTGAPGTGFAQIPGHNALVRATGNVIYPVELMSYQVE